MMLCYSQASHTETPPYQVKYQFSHLHIFFWEGFNSFLRPLFRIPFCSKHGRLSVYSAPYFCEWSLWGPPCPGCSAVCGRWRPSSPGRRGGGAGSSWGRGTAGSRLAAVAAVAASPAPPSHTGPGRTGTTAAWKMLHVLHGWDIQLHQAE